MSGRNVCSEIVINNLCIGCGVCAAVCPRGKLDIRFNDYGEYNAFETQPGCPPGCDMCLKVCPFFDGNDNEDIIGKRLFSDIPEIKHTSETGYFLDCFVGYSNVNRHRENGASGGLATWMLETLLQKGLIDYAMCVSPVSDSNKLFKFVVCRTPEEIRACSRSCYYPVEVSEVLRHVLHNDGRYAIIGLPCVCKAVRLAIQTNQILRQRVKYVLGLVCGRTKSKFFAEYICAMGGGNPSSIESVCFRIKQEGRRSYDHGMRWKCDFPSGGKEGVVFQSDGMSGIWKDGHFTPTTCFFCNDVFAECADVTFMDAWLNDYYKDHRGHNLVIVRKRILSDILKRAGLELQIEEICIGRVIQSQTLAIQLKQKDLLSCDKFPAYRLPRKHPPLFREQCAQVSRRLVSSQVYRIACESRLVWLSTGSRRQYDSRLSGPCMHLRMARTFDKWWRLLIGAMSKLTRASRCLVWVGI